MVKDQEFLISQWKSRSDTVPRSVDVEACITQMKRSITYREKQGMPSQLMKEAVQHMSFLAGVLELFEEKTDTNNAHQLV